MTGDIVAVVIFILIVGGVWFWKHNRDKTKDDPLTDAERAARDDATKDIDVDGV